MYLCGADIFHSTMLANLCFSGLIIFCVCVWVWVWVGLWWEEGLRRISADDYLRIKKVNL
jgi:hypothetical protein